MRKYLLTALLGVLAGLSAGAKAEHVILTGGPALMQHEGYRVAPERHDRWWANFVRAATLRMELLRKEGSREPITWMVYKKGYEMRGREDGKPYVQYISDLAKKHKARLVWVGSSKQIFDTLNAFARKSDKISTFDYFGHSNPHAFMIDYSSDILGTSTFWIHEQELAALDARAFRPGARCYSYGCYTANSMSSYWHGQTGIPLYGSTEKTDYSEITHGRLPIPSSGGVWNY